MAKIPTVEQLRLEGLKVWAEHNPDAGYFYYIDKHGKPKSHKCGGYTAVNIANAETGELRARGYAVCAKPRKPLSRRVAWLRHKKDMGDRYCRKTGFRIALGRALKALDDPNYMPVPEFGNFAKQDDYSEY